MADTTTDTTADALIEVVPLQGKGKGVRALKAFRCGDVIVQEVPLFTVGSDKNDANAIAQKLRSLDKSQTHQFFDLANTYTNLHSFLGITQTNAIPIRGIGEESTHGICLTIARFNHSCSANAIYAWDAEAGASQAMAIKNIYKGEEVTVSYLDNKTWCLPRTPRRLAIRKRFCFDCTCELCSLTGFALGVSDTKRQNMWKCQNTIADRNTIVLNPGASLRACRELVRLMQDEVEGKVRQMGAYFQAAQVSASQSDRARATAFAQHGIDSKKHWSGLTDPDVLAFMKSPASIAHMKSDRWHTAFTDKKEPDDFETDEAYEKWLWRRCGPPNDAPVVCKAQ